MSANQFVLLQFELGIGCVKLGVGMDIAAYVILIRQGEIPDLQIQM